ncbi:hypothetical protein SLEP1_g32800 [Rubroshorea leprosula]|uniref:Uncharacterized protein n=1 Tax=Rubroshorea leprosula TaxID=152421 RepID=A0AAV5KEI5_9ROSI|nr:hypothetical protein SLEP1_g32800 [Rubroshorea leprosula]
MSKFMDDEYQYSPPSADEFLYEREDGISWKKWQCQINGSAAGFLNYGDNQMSDCSFESPHLLKKRDVSNQLDWASCVKEDTKDNLSSLSEESCSSSADLISVRDKKTYSPPNLRPSWNRIISDNTFDSSRNKHDIGDIVFAKETWKNDDWDDSQNGSDAFGSGICTGTPIASKSKQPKHLSSSFQNKIGPSQSWLFEEGCISADRISDFNCFGQTNGAEPTSLGSKLWNEDPLGDFPVPKSFVDSKSPSDRCKWSEPITCSPSSSFTAHKFSFCQPIDHRNSLDSPVY